MTDAPRYDYAIRYWRLGVQSTRYGYADYDAAHSALIEGENDGTLSSEAILHNDVVIRDKSTHGFARDWEAPE